jgi:hypothetical protein
MGYLGTDYLDLFQFHQISRETDFQPLSEPDSALEGVFRAQGESSSGMSHYGCLSLHSLAARSLTALMIWGMVLQVPCLTRNSGMAPPGSVQSL